MTSVAGTGPLMWRIVLSAGGGGSSEGPARRGFGVTSVSFASVEFGAATRCRGKLFEMSALASLRSKSPVTTIVMLSGRYHFFTNSRTSASVMLSSDS